MNDKTNYDALVNIREIIQIRDRLKNELAVVEKFLVIAKRQGLTDSGEPELSPESKSGQQSTLKPIIVQTNGDYGVIGKNVLEAIQLCPAEFTVTDVNEALSNDLKHPLDRTQISVALSRLKRQRKIEILKPKMGRKPAIYRRT